eukprot:m.97355 g.97355  ORF g.97355 m.97355 type:complete len:550 (-) comp22037_c0_seq4:83-1732(-)
MRLLVFLVAVAYAAQDCVPLAPVQSNDCKLTGDFSCFAVFGGAHHAGYCKRAGSSWACCSEKPPESPSPPAPVRPAGNYPAPLKDPVKRPNIILVLTDDQDIRLGSLHVQNKTKSLFQAGGTTFENAFVTLPICCPSRISILSGRYPHNTGAMSNTTAGWCSVGKYWKGPGQQVSMPVWFSNNQYRTGIFGKELNVNDGTTISPGWDRFFVLGGQSEGHYYADWFCDQGKRYNATADEYMTTLIRDRAVEFLNESRDDDRPFFAYVAPHAPHTRATPQPGTEGYFNDLKAPRTPAWNYSAHDHHWMVRTQEPATESCAGYSDELYRNRLKALLGVDELVDTLAQTLIELGEFDNTVWMYTADHGFHLMEWSMPYFKAQPYETDLRVPFMVRGPGITPGKVVDNIALNIDIAPTLAEFAGFAPPAAAEVDGRSLVPFALSNASQSFTAPWTRKDFLFEFWAGGNPSTKPAIGPYCNHIIMSWNNTYTGVRTADGLKYVEFVDNENFKEFFNLTSNPWELENQINSTDPAVVEELRTRLHFLQTCKEDTCH